MRHRVTRRSPTSAGEFLSLSSVGNRSRGRTSHFHLLMPALVDLAIVHGSCTNGKSSFVRVFAAVGCSAAATAATAGATAAAVAPA